MSIGQVHVHVVWGDRTAFSIPRDVSTVSIIFLIHINELIQHHFDINATLWLLIGAFVKDAMYITNVP